MRPKLIHIRWWCPETGKIKHRLTTRNDILIGADRTCDLRMPQGSEGFVGRVDFQKEEFEDLQTGQLQRFPAKSVQQIGQLAMQWGAFEFPRSRAWLCSLAFGLIGMAILLGISFQAPDVSKRPGCFFLEEWLAGEASPENGNHVSESIRAFELAIRKNQPALARAEWQGLQRVFQTQLCADDPKRLEFEWRLESLEVLHWIQAGELLLAAERWKKSLHQERMKALRTEILRRAESLFWAAWREERKEPLQALKKRILVEEVCGLLNEGGICFDRDSRNKEQL
jgi:hypothetical protein